MGVVWAAVDEYVKRPVAIKLVLPTHTEEAQAHRLARLDRERTVLIELSQHPNIVTLLDTTREPLGYVMEWLGGFDLEEWLFANPGPQSPDIIASLFAPILDAVGYAHDHGVVHRDLKTSNIFLQILGTQVSPRVMDFGLARIIQQSSDITTERLLIGTPQYMAPEQVLGTAITPQTDIYALGIVLFECLTGAQPIQSTSESPVPLLMKKVNAELPSPRAFYPQLSQALSEVIIKATRRAPAERFANCAEFSNALFDALGAQPTRRLRLEDMGTIPPNNDDVHPLFHEPSSPDVMSTSDLSFDALYGNISHSAVPGIPLTEVEDTLTRLRGTGFEPQATDQIRIPTAVNRPVRDADDSIIGTPIQAQTTTADFLKAQPAPTPVEHGTPTPSATPAEIPVDDFDTGDLPVIGKKHLVRYTVIGLLTLVAIALLIAFPTILHKARVNEAANTARHAIDDALRNVEGQQATSTTAVSALTAYSTILDIWNRGSHKAIRENYREPVRCYYNAANLPRKDLPFGANEREELGLPQRAFSPYIFYVTHVGEHAVTLIESGTSASQDSYERLIQLTRSSAYDPWRVSVEVSADAHDCYNDFSSHHNKLPASKRGH